MKVNRREFLGTASAGAAAVAWRPRRQQPVAVSDRVRALYERAIVIDSLSFEEWDEEGFAAAAASGYTAIQTSLPNRNFAVAMEALEQWRERFTTHADRLLHCTRAADIERAKREGKLAVILGFQNATVFDDEVDNVDRLYEAGARCVQLTYNARNRLGDGCTERITTGLSDFGIACVRRMNELGMIVDLSHCGEGTSSDGIALSAQPPCFTHTMCQALHFHPRAKSDALLEAMARRGGMVGIAALGYFVSPRADATVADYVDHVEHAVQVCGIEHVGLCTDFQIRGIEASATRENWYEPRLRTFKPSYNVRWPPWIPELDTPDRFRVVAQQLADRGFTDEQILRLLGGNWLEYFRTVFGG